MDTMVLCYKTLILGTTLLSTREFVVTESLSGEVGDIGPGGGNIPGFQTWSD